MLTQPAENSKVWRYMNFNKFFDLLSKNKLYFVRLDKLSDNYEGTLSHIDKLEIKNNYEKLECKIPKKEVLDRTNADITHIHKDRMFTLVNCWTNNQIESYAYWKIYLDNQPCGVAIQTKFHKLKKSIIDNRFKFKYHKVYYALKPERRTQLSVTYRKNKFYRFEKELRIATFGHYESFGGYPKYEHGVEIEVDLRSLIEKIYISPFASAYFYDFVQFIVQEKFQYNFRISKSKIIEH